jgi:RNA polymerase sigma-70 factor (ECF subfamily)
VREHARFVARSLRRLGVQEGELEDAVQEVFIVAVRKEHQVIEGTERSFLYGTALRIASNARRVGERARARRVNAPADWSAGPSDGPTTEEIVDQRRARQALDMVLETMDVDERAVFTLYELEELTVPEIATLLGVPQGTVSSRLRRAREQFESEIQKMHEQARGMRGTP